MNTKGELSALKVVGSVILILALVWILLSIGQETLSGFAESINTCSGREGVCKQSCGENEQQLFQAAGACDTGVCCTSDEIKSHLSDNKVVPGSNAIQLQVEDRRKLYSAEERIPLFTGREYTFHTYIDSKILEEGQTCQIYITDESTDQILYVRQNEDNPKAEISDPCSNIADDQSRGDKSGSGLSNIQFTSSNLKQNIQVHVEVLNDGQRVAKATYPIDLTRPVSVVGLQGEWTQEESFRLNCNVGDCESADYRFMMQGQFSNCNEQLFTGSEIETSKVFLDDQVGFFINGSTVRQRIGTGYVNQPLCIEVNMRGGETLYFPTKNVRVDSVPPHSLGLDGTTITCEDRGSGCDEYYYSVRDEQTESDITSDENLEQSILDFISRTAKQGKCPTTGYTRSSDDEINVDGVVYANVCIYARDRAGNENEPEFQAYVGTEEAKQGFFEQAKQRLEEELQNSD